MSDISDPSVQAASNLSQCLIPAGQLNSSNRRDFVTITPAALATLAMPTGGTASYNPAGVPIITLSFPGNLSIVVDLSPVLSGGGGSTTPDGALTDPQGSVMTSPQGDVVTNN
jgi:hypothetical protein